MEFDPHITVATVVKQGDKYLFVEELALGEQVINQPAGHVDGFETLEQAALRETFEETAWRVKMEGVIGMYAYTSPKNGVTYYRVNFFASPIEQDPDARLDTEIIRTLWLNRAELLERKSQLRSPLVVKAIDDYEQRGALPLDIIHEIHPEGWINSSF